MKKVIAKVLVTGFLCTSGVHAQNITIVDVKNEVIKLMRLDAELRAAVEAGIVDRNKADYVMANKCPDPDEVSADAARIAKTKDINVVAKVYADALMCNSAMERVLGEAMR
jgi:hypothetical protein